jgi:hypothetical protein
MSDSAQPRAVPQRRIFVRTAASAYSRRRARAIVICLLIAFLSVTALAMLSPDRRVLAAPLFAIVFTSAAYMMILWTRDGVPPVFEAGTLCVLAIAAYGTLPLVGFLLMNGQWDPAADNRLFAYPFIPAELGMFGWRYAVYAASFVAAYLLVRGKGTVRTTAFTMPKPHAQTALAIVFAAIYLCKIGLRLAYGYNPEDFDYSSDPTLALLNAQAQPYFVQQVGHNVLSALFVVQLGVIVLLLAHWRKRWCRYALGIWLVAELLSTAIRLGSRGRVVLLFLTAGVLYHRLVRRLNFRILAIAGSLMLSGFLVLGAIRVVRPGDPMKERAEHVLTVTNEFQALFTTAFDIHKRKEAGEVQSVPWQVYVSDFYLPIPSQLLPFEKLDPSQWYIDLIGQTGVGIGYMFGVMSQAAVGLDWIELVLRGVALAVCLALLHRWYVRRATRFWPTLLYLFVSIWAYYSFRASTFYFLYFVIYHFVPVLLVTILLEKILSRMRRDRPSGTPA